VRFASSFFLQSSESDKTPAGSRNVLKRVRKNRKAVCLLSEKQKQLHKNQIAVYFGETRKQKKTIEKNFQ
jgi:hypothetical protein